MPQARKRRNESDGDQTAEGRPDLLDQARRRRLRNRLSQRNFRERKSMYIKELEERSRVNAQSESERNRALMREAGELRAEMLRLRSKVLKLATSLNGIGSEIGKVLNVEGIDTLLGEEACHRATPTESEPSPADSSSMALRGQSPNAVEEDGEQAQVHERNEPRTSSEIAINLNETSAPPIPNDITELADQGQSIHMEIDTSKSNAPSTNTLELHDSLRGGSAPTEIQQASDLYVTNALESSHDVAGVHKSNPALLQVPNQTRDLGNFIDPPFQDEFVFEGLESTYNLSPDLWMTPFPLSGNDSNACILSQETSQDRPLALPHQTIAGNTDLDQRSNIPLPVMPSQARFVLPSGLLPAPKNSSSSVALHSRLSDHIETLEKHVRAFLVSAPAKVSRQRLYQCCTTIMSLSIQNAWPATYPVWFKSQVPEIIWPIILWRIQPTTEAHKNLLPTYKPTELQLKVPHSAIIDWIPYAPLRDRVLLNYNGSVALDRMMCDLLNNYAVEVDDVSLMLHNAPPGRGYFGVWNVFKAIHGSKSSSAGYTSCSVDAGMFEDELLAEGECARVFDDVTPGLQIQEVPPEIFPLHSSIYDHRRGAVHPTASEPGAPRPLELIEILRSPPLALRLAHDIRLYAAKSWRLDRTFFQAWPELKFDGYEKIVARGRSYRLPLAPPDAPIQINEEMAAAYRVASQTIR